MRPARPWSGLGAALLGAVSLHVLAATMVAVGQNATKPLAAAASALEPKRLTIELRPVSSEEAAPEPAVDPEPAPPPETATVAPAEDPVASTTSSPTPRPLAAPDAAEAARYFNVGEVDKPAVPRPDWQVDVPLLMGLGVRSFSVDVLIDEAGTAEHCAVTRIEPEQSPDLRQVVAAKLCETVLSPAMRRGVAVRSIRHIELLLAPP